MQQIADPDDILLRPGAIQPQRAVDARNIVRRGVGAEQGLRGIARNQLHHQKDDDGKTQDHRNGCNQSLGDIAEYADYSAR